MDIHVPRFGWLASEPQGSAYVSASTLPHLAWELNSSKHFTDGATAPSLHVSVFLKKSLNNSEILHCWSHPRRHSEVSSKLLYRALLEQGYTKSASLETSLHTV